MIRIGTFKIENLDSEADINNPKLLSRISVSRYLLDRMGVDILCLQEVHGQELPDHLPEHPMIHSFQPLSPWTR